MAAKIQIAYLINGILIVKSNYANKVRRVSK
jgi:hypothetical protein